MLSRSGFAVEDRRVGALDAVVLRDGGAGSEATVIPARGALVTSLIVGGEERLYLDEGTLHDPTQNVRGGVPVLFPSPGRLSGDRFAFGERGGAMKQHGFARRSVFREIGRGTDDGAWVELELTDSEPTRAEFPFRFTLRLRVTLEGAELRLDARVQNPGDAPLPFALGYHPYFRVPAGDKSRSAIPTRAKVAWDNVAKRAVPFTAPDLGAGEVDLHLEDHGATRARLETPRGAVEISGDLPRWVIWTLPGRDFVCLEPWTSPADALNTGAGLSVLGPGEATRLRVAIRVG